MNQHLKTIQDLLQQNKTLSDADKEALLKSIIDADKQWSITDFKLDRTEKVKKTTAILLEETIEELEQKRKAVEAQNRELEIESSLERVRAVAMGMKKSDDLLSICEVLFKELQTLGFTHLRNTLINTFVDEQHYFIDYDFSDFAGGSSTRIPYSGHPVIEKYIKEATKKNDAFIEMVVTGKELEDWKEFRRANGETDDKRLENIAALYYYNYSIGVASIGISTFQAITKEKLEVLKRFRNVFDLAYRRFTDIQQAEAQARESQIELGLERVRARAMAMQRSDELSELVDTVFKELTKLDFALTWCIINIIDEPSLSNTVWAANPDINKAPESYHMLFEDYPFHHAMMKGWKERQTKCVYVLEGNEKKVYDEYLFSETEFKRTPEAAQAASRAMEKYVVSFSFSNFGGLQTVGDVPLTGANLDILSRFGKVFDLTYTRFNDLKKAEAQALEAIKRASIDRVRAEIASMRTTRDLERIQPLIWNELKTLDVPFIRCGVFIMDEEKQEVQTMLSTPGGKAIATLHVPFEFDLSIITNGVKYWCKKKLYTEYWDAAAFTKVWIKLSTLRETSMDLTQTEHPPESLHLHMLPFLQGMLYVGSEAPLNDGQLQLVQNLADAFSTAYARYEDFNKLEAAKKQVDNTLNELQVTQKQLIQSEKMASLGELTAGIAHEIQNPLNFVNNFSEVSRELLDEMKTELDNGNTTDAKDIATNVMQNLEKILHHGKRADGIVKGMLQHSRSSSGQKEPTDINVLTDEYLRLAYHGLRAKDNFFNAVLETDFDDSVGKMNIIPQDMGRVILNLITNAFYAVTEKRKQVGEGFNPTVAVSTHKINNRDGYRVEIGVKDNGCGISQKVMDKIFQPFFTTKPTGQGTGLGLSLSYDIVKAHGGELKVETKEGEGTQFIVVLPVNS